MASAAINVMTTSSSRCVLGAAGLQARRRGPSANARSASERTARGQARSVYHKAGLDSRAALSAFFLEDLLPPRESNNEDA